MQSRCYFGYFVRQRLDEETVPFFVFAARSKDIQQWAGVKRIAEHSGGTQRPFRESRARAIKRFFEAETINTIPNSVLVAFEPNAVSFSSIDDKLQECLPELDFFDGCDGQIQWGTLSFDFDEASPDHQKAALIVDGQHRLSGMFDYEEEDIPVVVVALIDASPKEQAFQFIVINAKAVRVATESAKSIVADLDGAEEEELGERLLKAGIKYKDISPVLRDINDWDSSPFRGLLKWSYNRNGVQLVELTAIEQALRYLESVFSFFEDDEDSKLEMFLALWGAISSHYSDIWGRDDNNLMRKVSLNAVNEFTVDRLKMAWEFELIDIFKPDQVKQQSIQIIGPIPKEFWEAAWTIRIQDNANIRALIKADMEQMAENRKLRRGWTEDLKIVTGNQDTAE